MNQKEAIETLKTKAANDKALDAVLHVFALRRRARQNVTVGGLMQRMKAEGFSFEPKQYEEVLKTLAHAGFGRLEHKGSRIIALRDVKVALQSIGKAALGQEATMRNVRRRNRFTKIMAQSPQEVAKTPKIAQNEPREFAPAMGLTVAINGKAISIPVPKDFTAEDVTSLVLRFRNTRAAS